MTNVFWVSDKLMMERNIIALLFVETSWVSSVDNKGKWDVSVLALDPDTKTFCNAKFLISSLG